MSTSNAQMEMPASASSLVVENSALRQHNGELLAQIQALQHDIVLLQRRLYGARTEKAATSEQQALFAEMAEADCALQQALAEAEALAKAGAEANANAGKERKPRQGAKPLGRRDLSQSKLPRVEIEITSPTLEAQGHKRVGVDVSYEIIGHKSSYSVLVKRTVRYQDNRPTSAQTTLSAQQAPRLFAKGLLHESVVAKILTEKFALGTTLYRMEKHMATQEVPIDRATMSRLIEQAGNALGASIVAAMFRHAKASAHVISTDATGAWILPEPSQVKQPLAKRCDKGHFFTAVVDADAVLFFYEREHTQAAVQRLFQGYAGYLQADASSVYHLLEHGPPRDEHGTDDDSPRGVTLVGCFAHCRRYFFEAAQCRYPEGVLGLGKIAALFAADKPLWKLKPEERHHQRQLVVAPLMDAFFAWIRDRQANRPLAERNLITRALGYATNQEHELRRVLTDPHLPLDNTRAERALRTPVISRKNSLFHGSDTHAEAAAAIFSLLQTCRLHGIEPQGYFEDVLRLVPQWPNDRYLELAPNFWRKTKPALLPHELALPIAWFTIPQPLP